MGIPLKEPGFYVVELASPRLGTALLGAGATAYYVQTTALVTNLSVHLKLGREASLVWVTSLVKAQPVDAAAVEVRDCDGRVHWKGKTDAQGIARIDQPLPDVSTLPPASETGIASILSPPAPMATSVSCFRIGTRASILAVPPADRRLHRTVSGHQWRHGPHVAACRRHRAHEALLSPAHSWRLCFHRQGPLARKLVIRHAGSDQKYEQPLVWDEQGIAEST